jgi:CBS domain-containing protein
MIDRDELLAGIEADPRPSPTLGDLVAQPPIVAHPHETCRSIATRMAVHGVERLPVVADGHPPTLLGIISRSDLVNPSARLFEDEVKRERLNPIASADEA